MIVETLRVASFIVTAADSGIGNCDGCGADGGSHARAQRVGIGVNRVAEIARQLGAVGIGSSTRRVAGVLSA